MSGERYLLKKFYLPGWSSTISFTCVAPFDCSNTDEQIQYHAETKSI